MKALRINVYKNPCFRGCSNNGISEKYENLLLVCNDGNFEIDTENPPENLCKVVTRHLFGRDYKHIEPYTAPDKGFIGWMHGGSYAATSDSRFSDISDYPLAIHDRQETTAQYERMSR